MKKWRLLPGMALKGIMANGMVYYPYMIASVFAVFLHYVFSYIHHNDLMRNLPYASYAWVMMALGKGLLEIILLIFLLYAGSFVMKRRKKEVGLYSLLGLEKRHIGAMLFWENLILYTISLAGGIILGVLLSKFMTLLFLRLSGIVLNVDFVLIPAAFTESFLYFGVVFFIIFLHQLWEVGKSRPTELLSGSRRGEKEPRFLIGLSLIGAALLGGGYFFSVNSQADAMILINFFLAVLLVIVGTYFVFTAGSVLFLKCMRRNKKLYYKPENFITISGMYYRMKKNAAGLVNICIFSTMVIITLICTAVVFAGLEDSASYIYPYDETLDYLRDEGITREQAEEKLRALEGKYDLRIERADLYEYASFSCAKEGNSFVLAKEDAFDERNCGVIIMTLPSYEELSGEKIQLGRQEILIYTEGVDFGYDTFSFMGIEGRVKEEVQSLYPYPKAESNKNARYIIIVPDEAARNVYLEAWGRQNGVEDMDSFLQSGSRRLAVLLAGDEEEKRAFVEELAEWGQQQTGFRSLGNGMEGRTQIRVEFGGLLFIGVIFGVAFFVCLIIIMYYKQISEGYEDMGGFAIMQQVGMSETEIKSTVHKQILLVFGLPLLFAFMHTFAGMFMVEKLLIIIAFYNVELMRVCAFAVCALFGAAYGISYWKTAKVYYRIVNRTDS